MYRFLESIRICNGAVQLAQYHESRMHRTIRHFGDTNGKFDLRRCISIPPEFRNGEVKCRFLYSVQGNYKYEFTHYIPSVHKRIGIIEVPGAEYSFKYSDRTLFNNLLAAYPAYDDLIITVNGFLADASYANIVLELNGALVTPANPLLQGVQRSYLLAEKKIAPASLRAGDIVQASAIRYINALLPLGVSPAYKPDVFEIITP